MLGHRGRDYEGGGKGREGLTGGGGNSGLWSKLLDPSARYFSNKSITTSNKKLLGAPGRTTRTKDATRGSWPYY